MGNTGFYGPGLTVDTTKPFTVVTQFLTSDNTSTGTLSEIRRLYVQNNQVIANSKTNVPGMATFDSVTTDFCTAQMAATNNTNSFQQKGKLSINDYLEPIFMTIVFRWPRRDGPGLRKGRGPRPLHLGRLRRKHALARLRLPDQSPRKPRPVWLAAHARLRPVSPPRLSPLVPTSKSSSPTSSSAQSARPTLAPPRPTPLARRAQPARSRRRSRLPQAALLLLPRPSTASGKCPDLNRQ